jgi:uncharacterized protein (TIGR02271 family)
VNIVQPKRRSKAARAEATDEFVGRSQTIPVIEETLQVEKVARDRGGYRITKRVQTHEELVDEPLRHHEVTIERRTLGLNLKGRALPKPRYEGETYIVPVIKEVLVTKKQWVLVEEVRITAISGTHHDPQHVTLRREDVSIERLDADEPSSTLKLKVRIPES